MTRNGRRRTEPALADEVPAHVLGVPQDDRRFRLTTGRHIVVTPVSAARIRDLRSVEARLRSAVNELDRIEADLQDLKVEVSRSYETLSRDEEAGTQQLYRDFFRLERVDPVKEVKVVMTELETRREEVLRRHADSTEEVGVLPQLHVDSRAIRIAAGVASDEIEGQVLLRGYAAIADPEMREVASGRFREASRIGRRLTARDRNRILREIGEEALSLEVAPLLSTPEMAKTWQARPLQQELTFRL